MSFSGRATKALRTSQADARSLDRYAKPRATRGVIVRAFPGPSVVPGPRQPKKTEPRSAEVLRE